MFGSTKSIEGPASLRCDRNQSPPVAAGGFAFLGQLPETHNYPSLIKPNNSALQKKVSDNNIYKLFPTKNYWTFIKLDTRNGKMWQVHFTISDDGYQGELILNSSSLLMSDEVEINGRFNLYRTSNIYNFIFKEYNL